MKSIKIAGLCLVSMFAMSMATTSTASANPVWEGCLEGANVTKYLNSHCVTLGAGNFGWKEIGNTDHVVSVGFTILLTDTKATGGSSTIRCLAGGRGSGTVGPGGFGRVELAFVENAKENCERESGGCKAGEVEAIEAIHMPWQTKLSEKEGKILENIENSGNGEPGWKVKCNTLLGKQTDECESTPETGPEKAILEDKLVNGVQLVFGTGEGAVKQKCSQGGNNSGEAKGFGALLLATANNVATEVGLRVEKR